MKRALFLFFVSIMFAVFFLILKSIFTANDTVSKFSLTYYFLIPDFIKNAPKVSDDYYFTYDDDPDRPYTSSTIVFKNVKEVNSAKKQLEAYAIQANYIVKYDHHDVVSIFDLKTYRTIHADRVVIGQYDNGELYLDLYDYYEDLYSEIEFEKLNSMIIDKYKKGKLILEWKEK